MSSRISYMGTKHDLAGRVAEVISGCRAGRLLDAFAGMGAVADAHAGGRPVWINDVQHFAYLAGRCRFTDPVGPLPASDIRELAASAFQHNMDLLKEQNSVAWEATKKMQAVKSFDEFSRLYNLVAAEVITGESVYACFTKSYANAYFSLVQCAEIDSIRYAIDSLRDRGMLTLAHHDWALLALGQAALRIANTTGHFAQFLTPNEKNFLRVVKQFVRPVFEQWLASLSLIKPSGTPNWRAENYATRDDCQNMLKNLTSSCDVGIVYCDPPYTDDQYSRFYHVWETLVLYDYPELTGAGRYRPDRFTTPFSLRSKVKGAFHALVNEVAATGADLVLSYPSNGLLHDVGVSPLDVLRSAYPKAEQVAEIQHNHSTMGASKGKATASVAECLYVARA
jgi:adenine-specific DNA-methyltransferase